MNRVLASFTSGERNIIVFVMAMVAGGYGLLEWQSARESTMTFSAAPSAVAAELDVPTAMPAGINSGGLVDVNVADGKVLETLPGIGPALAGAIIRHRAGSGAFASMADLDEVPGIGPVMMAKLAPLVTFGAGASALPVSPGAGDAGAVGGVPVLGAAPITIADSGAGALININTAGPTELDKLKGIGPALAARIVQHRQLHGPFRSPEELDNVKGIGVKILQDNRAVLSIR